MSVPPNAIVSFIIPNWNHCRLLSECISSVYGAAGLLQKEIIVVDNASNDDSAECIKQAFPDVVWIQNRINLGYAKAVNQGVATSKGSFLFFLNNDVVLHRDTTAKLLSFLVQNPDAGAVAPLLYYPDGRLQISCRRFPAPSSLILEAFGISKIGSFCRWKLSAEEHLKGGIVKQPMMSALLIKKECWDAAGPMDERFPLYFNDVDWCFRLYNNTKYNIHLCPETSAVHHHGASTGLLGYKKRALWLRGLLRFYLKHYL